VFHESKQIVPQLYKTAGKIIITHIKVSFGSSGLEHKTGEDIKLRQFNADIDLESRFSRSVSMIPHQ
jgi:hypothetical protein